MKKFAIFCCFFMIACLGVEEDKTITLTPDSGVDALTFSHEQEVDDTEDFDDTSELDCTCSDRGCFENWVEENFSCGICVSAVCKKGTGTFHYCFTCPDAGR